MAGLKKSEPVVHTRKSKEMNLDDIKAQLAATDFFADQAPVVLDRVIDHAISLRVRKGEYVFQEGQTVSAIYLVVSGRLQAHVSDSANRKYVLMFNNPGELMGEVSYLDGGPCAWSAMAEEDCLLFKFNRQDLISIFGTADGLPSDSVRNRILVSLAGMVRRISASAKSLALLDVYGRIRLLFNDYTVNHDGVMQLQKTFTQQEIADQIGSSREMVARILKELVFGRYIAMENRRIVLLKMLPENF